MARKARQSKGKTMLPNYFVFCEGDTEVIYVEALRAHYRLPIHIIAKKTLLNITSALVERCKAAYIQTKKDKTFLMYDLDVPTVLEKLQKIPNTILLCSNPCFELWLLLHYVEVKTSLTSAECVNRLQKQDAQYKKGKLTQQTRTYILSHTAEAISKARLLEEFKNPSTTVYKLVEQLESIHSESKTKKINDQSHQPTIICHKT